MDSQLYPLSTTGTFFALSKAPGGPRDARRRLRLGGTLHLAARKHEAMRFHRFQPYELLQHVTTVISLPNHHMLL